MRSRCGRPVEAAPTGRAGTVPPMTISRRALLIGGAAAVATAAVGTAGGVALVDAGVLPGRSWVRREVLGACDVAAPVPDVEPGPTVSGRFLSTPRGGVEVGWSAIYPPGAKEGDALPVCLALHGRGGNHTDPKDALHLDRFLAEAVDQGRVPPFVIASIDGGDALNWHPRAGADPVAMITDEYLPLLSRRGLDTSRPATWGWSLGGYGALYLVTTRARPWAGAVASSPALWRWPGEWAPGTFDGADDFAAHGMWNRIDLLGSTPLRIDCGRDDPFEPRVRQFRAELHPTPAGGIEKGCHDSAFWMHMAPAQLDFLGPLFT